MRLNWNRGTMTSIAILPENIFFPTLIKKIKISAILGTKYVSNFKIC